MPRNCFFCSKNITSNNLFLPCSKCNRPFHAECVNSKGSDIEYLKNRNEKWNCHVCVSTERSLRSNSCSSRTQPSVASPPSPPTNVECDNATIMQQLALVMNQLHKLNNAMTRMEKRHDDVLSQLAICNSKIDEHSSILAEHGTHIQSCQREVSDLQGTYTELSAELSRVSNSLEALKTEPKTSNNDIVSAAHVQEIVQRVKRSHNLIIQNLPEFDTESLEKSKVNDLVENISETSSRFIVRSERLPSSVKSRPRLLKVTFSDPEVVSNILRNKAVLKSREEYNRIIIRDDKTKGQIDELRTLREELAGRQASGKTGLTIKYVKGVPRIINSPTVPQHENLKKN
ncbi:uncharacterized protein LOC123316374 [Coccinella septempunctata]|uniref:uncharacterized protein LOC123316374 n=1 Tax=Coccinella septempunctata TaxID=41139 RepID=UPI001D085174|nr:uncharacterized protein LOC123316374 [Coccinella septempunctata]